jgi:hypothetical protein
MDFEELSLVELLAVEGGGVVDTIGAVVDRVYHEAIRAAFR